MSAVDQRHRNTIDAAHWRVLRRWALRRRVLVGGSAVSLVVAGMIVLSWLSWAVAAAGLALFWVALVGAAFALDRAAMRAARFPAGERWVTVADEALVIDDGEVAYWLRWATLRPRRLGELLALQVGPGWLLINAAQLPDEVTTRVVSRCGQAGPAPRPEPEVGFHDRSVAFVSSVSQAARALRASSPPGSWVWPVIGAPVVMLSLVVSLVGGDLSTLGLTSAALWSFVSTRRWWRPWLAAWFSRRGVDDAQVRLCFGPDGMWTESYAGATRVPWGRVQAVHEIDGLLLLTVNGQVVSAPSEPGLFDELVAWRLRARPSAPVHEAADATNPFAAPRRA